MMTKTGIRRIIKQRKNETSPQDLAEKSRIIIGRLQEILQIREARRFFVYMDMPGEVQIRIFTQQCLSEGKEIAIPKMEGRDLHFYKIESFRNLTDGVWHIQEPDPQFCPCADDWEDAIMIMPGVAFDRTLHRVGYGGGFYDRYIEKHGSHFTVAAAYDFQIFDEVPFDEHDRPCDLIVTEAQIIRADRIPCAEPAIIKK